jgi:hypothetical protein
VTKEPHTQLFNEVLEGMAYAKLSPNEWQFIMVLWRLTYGRKNMTHKESGKFTTWINAEFHRRTGIHRPHITRIKNNLLAKKVIIQKKGMIGFNKHFKKWDNQCYLDRSHVTSTGITSTGNKVLPVQATNVTSTGNTNAPKVKSSAEVERLKKERKKEIHTQQEISDKNFEVFWEKYPKKRDSKTAARKAWTKHYLKDKSFTLERILEVLQIDIDGVFKDASENKYIPGAGPWLNRKRWLDVEEEKKGEFHKGWTYKDHLTLLDLELELNHEQMKVGVEFIDQEELQTTIKHLSQHIQHLKQKKEKA